MGKDKDKKARRNSQDMTARSEPFVPEDYSASHSAAIDELDDIMHGICEKAWRREVVQKKMKPKIIENFFKIAVNMYQPKRQIRSKLNFQDNESVPAEIDLFQQNRIKHEERDVFDINLRDDQRRDSLLERRQQSCQPLQLSEVINKQRTRGQFGRLGSIETPTLRSSQTHKKKDKLNLELQTSMGGSSIDSTSNADTHVRMNQNLKRKTTGQKKIQPRKFEYNPAVKLEEPEKTAKQLRQEAEEDKLRETIRLRRVIEQQKADDKAALKAFLLGNMQQEEDPENPKAGKKEEQTWLQDVDMVGRVIKKVNGNNLKKLFLDETQGQEQREQTNQAEQKRDANQLRGGSKKQNGSSKQQKTMTEAQIKAKQTAEMIQLIEYQMDPNSVGPRQEEVKLFERFKIIKSDHDMMKMLGQSIKQQATDDLSKKQKNGNAFETVEMQKLRKDAQDAQQKEKSGQAQPKKKDNGRQVTLGGELQPANGVKFREFQINNFAAAETIKLDEIDEEENTNPNVKITKSLKGEDYQAFSISQPSHKLQSLDLYKQTTITRFYDPKSAQSPDTLNKTQPLLKEEDAKTKDSPKTKPINGPINKTSNLPTSTVTTRRESNASQHHHSSSLAEKKQRCQSAVPRHKFKAPVSSIKVNPGYLNINNNQINGVTLNQNSGVNLNQGGGNMHLAVGQSRVECQSNQRVIDLLVDKDVVSQSRNLNNKSGMMHLDKTIDQHSLNQIGTGLSNNLMSPISGLNQTVESQSQNKLNLPVKMSQNKARPTTAQVTKSRKMPQAFNMNLQLTLKPTESSQNQLNNFTRNHQFQTVQENARYKSKQQITSDAGATNISTRPSTAHMHQLRNRYHTRMASADPKSRTLVVNQQSGQIFGSPAAGGGGNMLSIGSSRIQMTSQNKPTIAHLKGKLD